MSTTDLLPSQTDSSPRSPATLHQEVAMCTMAASADAVPALRAFAKDSVRRWELGAEVEDALAIIVSELVTNAYLHSGSRDVTVLLLAREGRLAVQVSDSGRWRNPTAHLQFADEATHGRGLAMVRAYAAKVHVHRSSRGTNVVAEVAPTACEVGAAA